MYTSFRFFCYLLHMRKCGSLFKLMNGRIRYMNLWRRLNRIFSETPSARWIILTVNTDCLVIIGDFHGTVPTCYFYYPGIFFFQQTRKAYCTRSTGITEIHSQITIVYIHSYRRRGWLEQEPSPLSKNFDFLTKKSHFLSMEALKRAIKFFFCHILQYNTSRVNSSTDFTYAYIQ